jgi:hypothetical protein
MRDRVVRRRSSVPWDKEVNACGVNQHTHSTMYLIASNKTTVLHVQLCVLILRHAFSLRLMLVVVEQGIVIHLCCSCFLLGMIGVHVEHQLVLFRTIRLEKYVLLVQRFDTHTDTGAYFRLIEPTVGCLGIPFAAQRLLHERFELIHIRERKR